MRCPYAFHVCNSLLEQIDNDNDCRNDDHDSDDDDVEEVRIYFESYLSQ